MAEDRRKVLEHRFQPAEYRVMTWSIDAEAGTTIEDCLDTAYYTHIARKLRPRHEIVIWGGQDEFRLHVVVRACGDNWARVAVLAKHEFQIAERKAVPIPETDRYLVKFRGVAKWSVLRVEDKKVMKDGMESEIDASRYLADLLEKEAVR